MLNLPPFDTASNRRDLNGGISAELKGISLIGMRVSRNYLLVYWSCVSAALFLGAWAVPFQLNEKLFELGFVFFSVVFDVFVVLLKGLCGAILALWVLKMNPRLRSDQVTDFCWQYGTPAAILYFVATLLEKGRFLW